MASVMFVLHLHFFSLVHGVDRIFFNKRQLNYLLTPICISVIVRMILCGKGKHKR